MQAVTNK